MKDLKNKNFSTALLLSIFFGGLGFDRFYLNSPSKGILKFLTLGGLGIWWIFDIIYIISKKDLFDTKITNLEKEPVDFKQVDEKIKRAFRTSASIKTNSVNIDQKETKNIKF